MSATASLYWRRTSGSPWEPSIDRNLSDLIGLIYEAALQPDLWPDVMRRTAEVTPSAVATLYSHDRIARTPTFQHTHGGDPAYMTQYVERWAASNPIIDAMATLGPGDIAGLAAILDYAAFTRTAFFQEWGRPQGYCDAINVMLERTPTCVASVSLIRHDDHGLADEGAIRRLTLLAPHFLRAVRIGRVLDHATVAHHRLAQVVDTLADAVLLLDDAGNVMHRNQAADDLVVRGLDMMRAAAAGGPQRIRARQGKAEPPRDDVVILTTNDGMRHVCHRLPLKPDQSELVPQGGPDLRMVVIRAMDPTSAASRVADHYGLTDRERDVLFGIVELGGIPQTASALTISAATARAHVKAVFAKTKTNRQSELVRLACSMVSPYHSSASQT